MLEHGLQHMPGDLEGARQLRHLPSLKRRLTSMSTMRPREEGGAKPVEPEVWGHHHMSWGKPSVEQLADKHRLPEICHGASDSVPEITSGLETCSALVSM